MAHPENKINLKKTYKLNLAKILTAVSLIKWQSITDLFSMKKLHYLVLLLLFWKN